MGTAIIEEKLAGWPVAVAGLRGRLQKASVWKRKTTDSFGEV
ncbi:hypothetical protein ABNN70_15105 [Sporolactobacillus sp. Y61]|jgi:hypothetical protein|uniref:Uncharacterized protein n=1 Tax=Sporolactobacillus sp. Y61 TaxID=3160863 RepID=A0AAU8IFD6_9BACL|nr:hypothetical protein [Sporolactobacillus sp. THM19-2]